MPTSVRVCSGTASSVRAIASTADVVAPLCTAASETSTQKMSAGAIGRRTMYSAGAAYSTLPRQSSGLCCQSMRLPSAPRLHMYSLGHSEVAWQKLHWNRPWSSHRAKGFMYALHREHRSGP